MADNTMTFLVHHKGEFTKDKYLGGLVQIYEEMDLDRFSYSEFMEWVKDLGYKEIGGIYVRKQINDDDDDWALVTNEAEMNEAILSSQASALNLFIDCNLDHMIEPVRKMQPHFIVRPKISPIQAKENNPKKRYPTKGGVGFSRLPPEEFQNLKNGTIGLGDCVKLFEKPAENENLVEGGCEVTGGKVNEYEMRRNKNVEENKKNWRHLG
ncbi:hypothetical protein POM88_021490 [Heracleum sosnowskyi]|uniref:PB1-like domain-containing protein n=1 Tax=Heracleum sosnowskyi TaxID=360622 RepID=A0AAD8IH00_9APIA|nr:hypothetical protein POM88_021490 [Heracleum sosnowskyi]